MLMLAVDDLISFEAVNLTCTDILPNFIQDRRHLFSKDISLFSRQKGLSDCSLVLSFTSSTHWKTVLFHFLFLSIPSSYNRQDFQLIVGKLYSFFSDQKYVDCCILQFLAVVSCLENQHSNSLKINCFLPILFHTIQSWRKTRLFHFIAAL